MQLRRGLWPIPAVPITSIVFRISTHHLQTDWYLEYYHDAQKLPMKGLMMMINNYNSYSNNNNNNNNGQISRPKRRTEEDLEQQ